MYQVSTQIVQPPIIDDNFFWIPLEQTLQVTKQSATKIEHPSILIVTHRRAFEHYKYECNKDIKVLCVGEKTHDFLVRQGFENVVYHKSAEKIVIEDLYHYYWLHGDKFKVNFQKDGSRYRENVVAIKTYSTHSLKENAREIKKVTPKVISVFSQGQYNLVESCGYIPDILRVVPSIKIKDKSKWKEIEVFNPA